MPRLDTRVAIVTGANSGIGYWTAFHLARMGARVVMACRDGDKAEQAKGQILSEVPAAKLVVSQLDLADQSSIRSFSTQFLSTHRAVDLLINNAGVMIPPFTITEDGFELQFGVNHLGHFALTGLLMPALIGSGDARVVTVASNAHRFGRIDFADPHHTDRYIGWEAYGQSKLANILFALELQRRLGDRGVQSLAAHPGFTATGLFRESIWMPFVTPLFGQHSDTGSWPTLRAATDPDATGGSYWGPRWFGQLWGSPVRVQASRQARDPDQAARLWSLSEEMTGVHFP